MSMDDFEEISEFDENEVKTVYEIHKEIVEDAPNKRWFQLWKNENEVNKKRVEYYQDQIENIDKIANDNRLNATEKSELFEALDVDLKAAKETNDYGKIDKEVEDKFFVDGKIKETLLVKIKAHNIVRKLEFYKSLVGVSKEDINKINWFIKAFQSYDGFIDNTKILLDQFEDWLHPNAKNIKALKDSNSNIEMYLTLEKQLDEVENQIKQNPNNKALKDRKKELQDQINKLNSDENLIENVNAVKVFEEKDYKHSKRYMEAEITLPSFREGDIYISLSGWPDGVALLPLEQLIPVYKHTKAVYATAKSDFKTDLTDKQKEEKDSIMNDFSAQLVMWKDIVKRLQAKLGEDAADIDYSDPMHIVVNINCSEEELNGCWFQILNELTETQQNIQNNIIKDHSTGNALSKKCIEELDESKNKQFNNLKKGMRQKIDKDIAELDTKLKDAKFDEKGDTHKNFAEYIKKTNEELGKEKSITELKKLREEVEKKLKDLDGEIQKSNKEVLDTLIKGFDNVMKAELKDFVYPEKAFDEAKKQVESIRKFQSENKNLTSDEIKNLTPKEREDLTKKVGEMKEAITKVNEASKNYDEIIKLKAMLMELKVNNVNEAIFENKKPQELLDELNALTTTSLNNFLTMPKEAPRFKMLIESVENVYNSKVKNEIKTDVPYARNMLSFMEKELDVCKLILDNKNAFDEKLVKKAEKVFAEATEWHDIVISLGDPKVNTISDKLLKVWQTNSFILSNSQHSNDAFNKKKLQFDNTSAVNENLSKIDDREKEFSTYLETRNKIMQELEKGYCNDDHKTLINEQLDENKVKSVDSWGYELTEDLPNLSIKSGRFTKSIYEVLKSDYLISRKAWIDNNVFNGNDAKRTAIEAEINKCIKSKSLAEFIAAREKVDQLMKEANLNKADFEFVKAKTEEMKELLNSVNIDSSLSDESKKELLAKSLGIDKDDLKELLQPKLPLEKEKYEAMYNQAIENLNANYKFYMEKDSGTVALDNVKNIKMVQNLSNHIYAIDVKKKTGYGFSDTLTPTQKLTADHLKNSIDKEIRRLDSLKKHWPNDSTRENAIKRIDKAIKKLESKKAEIDEKLKSDRNLQIEKSEYGTTRAIVHSVRKDLNLEKEQNDNNENGLGKHKYKMKQSNDDHGMSI